MRRVCAAFALVISGCGGNGNGNTTPAALAFDSASHEFGTVSVGSSADSLSFTLSNDGLQTSGAIVTSLTGDTSDFPLTDNCNGKMLGTSCTYVVTFAPTTFGSKSATITATGTPGGARSVTITGTGRDTVPLNVTTVGLGNVSGVGLDCGNGGLVCSVNVTRTTSAPTVMLTEVSGLRHTFSAWSGDCTGNTSTCEVTMSDARNVTATFVRPLLYWPLDVDGSNIGTQAGYAVTLSGTVSFVTGKFGKAAQFDTGAFGQVAGSARAVLSAYPQYTISIWVNTTTPNTLNSFFDFNNRTSSPFGGIQLSYFSATQFSVCAATTTTSFLTGSCPIFSAAPTGAWHNLILRYAGTGTGSGQGAKLEIYEDDVLTLTVANDAANDPIFNMGMSDRLFIGTGGIALDDIAIYNTTFTVAQQCTTVIGGTWTGTSCALP